MQGIQTIKKEAWREKTLRVEGLDCADCARQLQEGICRLNGVEECSLSYISGRLHLRYQGSLEQVQKMVSAHGYRLRETGEEEQGEAIVRQRVRQAAAAGVCLLAAILVGRLHPLLLVFFLLAAIAVGGQTTFRRAWQALRQKRLDMNVLMTVAVAGAILIGEWWEGAAIAFLFAASNALETYTAEKNRRSVRNLIQSVPETAHRLLGDDMETVPVATVCDSDLILIRPGEYIPLDGIVVSGTSPVSEAAITGEPLPVTKQEGSRVFAGTLNGHGSLKVQVHGTWQDSTLTKIVQLVEEAQERRIPTQQFIDRFARIYTPSVIALAAAIAILGPFVTGGGWYEWFYRGLALLLVACPCSLVIAAPVAVASALTSAARSGVLIKGGRFLEAIGEVKAILFDKTGTLTKGVPEVTTIVTFSTLGEQEIVMLAAGLEAHSEHILAEAVRKKAAAFSAAAAIADEFTSYPGKGVSGTIAGVYYLLGSSAYLAEMGVRTDCLQSLGESGKTIVALARGEELLGAMLISDVIRTESAAVIGDLRTLGIRHLRMLTGDRSQAAVPMANKLGLDDVSAEMLPGDKEAALQEAARTWQKTAMVGDGVNDAPALASATVGIAMGAAGSPTALETADIALLGDDLTSLPYAIRLSRHTMAIIRQNIVLSLMIKAIAIVLVFPGWLTLWLAIVADMGASLLVTLNGMRLLSYRKQPAK